MRLLSQNKQNTTFHWNNLTTLQMPLRITRKLFSFLLSLLFFLVNKIIDCIYSSECFFALFESNFLCLPDKRLYFIAGERCLFSFFHVNKSIKLRISFHPTEQQRVIRLKYLPISLENCVKSNKRKSSENSSHKQKTTRNNKHNKKMNDI